MTEDNKFEDYFSLLSEAVRHDIRNQIMVIVARAEIIREDTAKNGEQEISKSLDSIISASNNIIQQVDFLKKYGSGGNSWQSLTKIRDQCILPEGTEITVEEGVDKIYIYANSLIPKVFENLVNNSIMHGEGVSKISISYEVLESGDLAIIYKDNGVGIPPENKERIFKKGFGKNTGMGMFLVRSILNITDIQISETGQYGRGVEFRIKVPQGFYTIQ